MTDAVKATLPNMSQSGFVIDKDTMQALQSDSEVWSQDFPTLYQRTRIYYSNQKVPTESFQRASCRIYQKTQKCICTANGTATASCTLSLVFNLLYYNRLYCRLSLT